MRPGAEMLVSRRWEFLGKGNKGLIQAAVIKINSNAQLIGLYVSLQTKGEYLEDILDKLKRKATGRTILVDDFNARHCAWDNKTY